MTPRNTERLLLGGPAGIIETVIATPSAPFRGIALIAHPQPLQGGTLDNKVVQTLAKAFFALGYVAARFNFRGVGESAGSFDDGNGETEDALAVLDQVRARLGAHLAVALAGFSFGSFVQTRGAQRGAVEGLVLVGPAVGRFAMAPVPEHTIVVHGEQDDVVPLAGGRSLRTSSRRCGRAHRRARSHERHASRRSRAGGAADRDTAARCAGAARRGPAQVLRRCRGGPRPRLLHRARRVLCAARPQRRG